MKKIQLIILCLTIAFANSAQINLKNQIDSVSYSLGADIGSNLKKSGAENMNLDIFILAMKDAMSGKKQLISEQEQMQIIRGYFQSLQSKKYGKNKTEGEAFLNANKSKEGVKVTESGLQYIVLKEGSGEKPTIDSRVKTHYKGTLIDGTVFDSSYDRGEPAVFPITGVIKGWTEALQLMPVGSKWKIFIPANLAYAERGAGADIGPNATIIFEVELLEIVK